MYKATINDQETTRQISQAADGTFQLDEQTVAPDIAQINTHQYHVIHQQRGYPVEVLLADPARKLFRYKIHDTIIEVTLRDELDQMVEQLGMSRADEQVIQEINAPMPGLILTIAVAQGQAVKQGESLLTLEAMKMENVIKSPVDGTIAALHVQKGDSVEKNQLLLRFE